MKLRRRTITVMLYRITLTVLMVMMTFAAGCGTVKKEDKKTIRFAVYQSPAEARMMEMVLPDFEARHPGIEVKTEYIPGNFTDKLVTEIVGGSSPDVTWLYDTALPDLAAKGIFCNLDEFVKKDAEFDIEDFHPGALAFGTFRGKLYLMPKVFGAMVLFYNKDLFDAAGADYPKDGWTWEDFLSTAQKLTKDTDGDGKTNQWGIASMWSILVYPPFINQNGGRFFNEDYTRCLLDSPEAIEAVQFLHDLHNKYKVVAPPTFGGGVSQMDYELFGSGKAAMHFSDRSNIDYFKNVNWDIVPWPMKKKKAVHAGMIGYAICKQSKYPDEAWELVKYLVSENVLQKCLKENVNMPARKSLQKYFLLFDEGKNTRSYVDSLEYGIHDFQFPRTNEVMSVLSGELAPYIVGIVEGNTEDVCKKVSAKITGILQQK